MKLSQSNPAVPVGSLKEGAKNGANNIQNGRSAGKGLLTTKAPLKSGSKLSMGSPARTSPQFGG